VALTWARTWARTSRSRRSCQLAPREADATPAGSGQRRPIEAQFTALRYFTLDGTDHASHAEQASMIRRYIAWRSRHAHDQRLDRIVKRANVMASPPVARSQVAAALGVAPADAPVGPGR
jgi:hypothetical protein